MNLKPEQVEFLQKAAKAAVLSERQSSVPAQLILAQAIFESGWGAHCPGNNCFGIKSNGRGCGVQIVPTTEFVGGKFVHQQLAFECYSTLADCFADHALLISRGSPYSVVWHRFLVDHDYSAMVLAVGRIYATDPNYGATMLAFSTGSTVQGALTAARAVTA